MKIIYLIFFLSFSGYCIASDFVVEINGSFQGAAGQEIRLMQYTDQISYNETEIQSVIADSMGNFQLSFSLFEPQYVFFRIDHARMGMFVEPGKTYQLKFDPVDFTKLDDRRNPHLDPWYFNFEIVAPSNDLNHYINKFDSIFNQFLLQNFTIIHRTRNRQLFDNFRNHTDSLFKHVENEYFQNYYKYKFANYLRIANLERFDRLTREYIFDKPILFENTQYMNFFHTVFDSYALATSRNIVINDLLHTVNHLSSTVALMDSLGKDTLLRNEVLRELVMIKTLQELFDNFDFVQENVRSMLMQIATGSKFRRHRDIAQNTILELEHLRPDTPAPKLMLTNQSGQKIDIKQQFGGRFILLMFWATWCETCQLDKIAMQELYERYKNDFEFVSVSIDRHKSDFKTFLAENPVPWHSYYLGADFRQLDIYEVKAMPLFMIIDPNGNIARFPAPRPSENINQTFDELLHERRIMRN